MWVSDRVCVAVWDCVNAAAKDNEKFVLVCPSPFALFVPLWPFSLFFLFSVSSCPCGFSLWSLRFSVLPC